MSLPTLRILVALTTAVFIHPVQTAIDDPAPRPSLSEPSFSPDHRKIVFASGGDLWTVVRVLLEQLEIR
ncbi:MAG: hypothetical protein ABIQ55_00185 [Gemmatimonadaceae bacterium]